ncbi:MAG: lactonase family protein, partial [Actinobacteria bacterium]|nr:lactonase family protein [Actinomycetota bacterium]
AELCASRDGSVLYAGVRGSDTVGVLAVRGAGEALQLTALAEAGTHWPRHHVVVDDTLLVAGQLAHEIVSLTLDPRTGVPGRVRHRTPSPSPTRLLPMR